MDEQVLRGMAKWPDVPAVYGWLGLDRRGNWLLQGTVIANSTITAYISRNYERDSAGCWFFQNGPQRVYVELGYTPLVYRAVTPSQEALAIESHTGQRATALSGVWMDENGALLLETEQGIGVLHDHDLDAALAAFVDADGNAPPEELLDETFALVQAQGEAPMWLSFGQSKVKVGSIRSAEVPQRFGFVAQPSPAGSP